VRVAVGPEGGFTDAEVALAQEVGWHVVDLGPRILRIETAALALAVEVIAGWNGRYNSGGSIT
jgi:16S rRNA (uracil1498-N3)-methyltransferase